MGGFLDGATGPLRAVALLARTRRLRRLVFVPIVVNVIVGLLLYVVLVALALRVVGNLVGDFTGAAGIIGDIVRVLVAVVTLALVGLLMVRIGVVLGAPWYGRLSEELEHLRMGTGAPASPLTLRGAVRDLRRAAAFEVKKLALIVGIGLPVAALNLIPVAGPGLATVGGAALGATVVCLDFFDGPLERRQRSFRAKLAYIRASQPASAGFGLMCLALLSVPLLNLVTLPVCVAAGTLFYCDRPDVTTPRR